jgi:hypothetical protein
MNGDISKAQLIESKGAYPFVTKRTYRQGDGTTRIWSSRHHRKGLPLVSPFAVSFRSAIVHSLWMPEKLNWWIGTVFALGSALYILASICSLWPSLSKNWSLSSTTINTIFFAGSIPFTIAAFLQLYQAAVSEAKAVHRQSGEVKKRFGWYPDSAGWLSAALQFVGTILFNVNTLDALLPHLDWLQQDLLIWAPDIAGSILFLASGYLAFIEAGHAYWAWEPTSITWWVVSVNLLGCLAFMISAMFAFVPAGTPAFDNGAISVGFTLIGGVCFLLGSLLMLPETVADTVD